MSVNSDFAAGLGVRISDKLAEDIRNGKQILPKGLMVGEHLNVVVCRSCGTLESVHGIPRLNKSTKAPSVEEYLSLLALLEQWCNDAKVAFNPRMFALLNFW